MKEIIFSRPESEKYPVDELFDDLDAKQAQKVAWELNIMRYGVCEEF